MQPLVIIGGYGCPHLDWFGFYGGERDKTLVSELKSIGWCPVEWRARDL